MIKTVFFGTPSISVPILEALIEDPEYEVLAVVTEPQKMKGRGQNEPVNSPVFEVAQKNNIPILTPKSIKKDEEVQKQINSFGADIYIVIAYGKIIPESIFASPPHGTVNVHYSLLPELRGPSPVQWALLEGKKETGITLMKIDADMDHGPIISQEKISITPDDTFVTLVPKLNAVAKEQLFRDLPLYISGDISPKEQNHDSATFCKMISKDDGMVKWDMKAKEVYNMWRAFIVWPGIYSVALGKRINLKAVSVAEIASKEQVGTLFEQEKKLFVSCGGGILELKEVQPEGKAVMSARDFINGHRKLLGQKLTW